MLGLKIEYFTNILFLEKRLEVVVSNVNWISLWVKCPTRKRIEVEICTDGEQGMHCDVLVMVIEDKSRTQRPNKKSPTADVEDFFLARYLLIRKRRKGRKDGTFLPYLCANHF